MSKDAGTSLPVSPEAARVPVRRPAPVVSGPVVLVVPTAVVLLLPSGGETATPA